MRIDLASDYETEEVIKEILDMVDDNLFDDFEVDNIITKAIPYARTRVYTLTNFGYKDINNSTIVSYDHYYIKSKPL